MKVIQPFNADNFKCRCSAISKALAANRENPCITEKQVVELAELENKGTPTPKQKERIAELLIKKENSTKVILSDGYIDYLMEWYAWETQGMIATNKESLETLGMNKGRMVEEESGLLLSFVDNVEYKRHIDEETGERLRVSNDFLSGEIDWYLGESIYEAYNVTDTKNAFDYPTLLKKINKGLENGQKEQVQGYCDILQASEGYVAHTLVSNPPQIIEEMKWKVMKKLGSATELSPEFVIEWRKWERSMIFDHIPHRQRVHKFEVELFSDFERQKLYDRVKFGREFLWNFHEQYTKID